MPSLVDASSAIFAWENYPIAKFPTLWDWIAEQVLLEELQCIQVIIAEVEKKEKACFDFLKENSIKVIPVSDQIAMQAMSIKKDLKIKSQIPTTHKGVGENDIYLIATAILHGYSVITNEGIQAFDENSKHQNPKSHNYKIPLVCKKNKPPVECYSFLDYINKADAVF